MGRGNAYAVAINEANIRGVIHSEAGADFNLELALAWLKEHEEGWFLRDEESPLDCQFFMPEVFAEMYMFTSPIDSTSLFRQVIKI